MKIFTLLGGQMKMRMKPAYIMQPVLMCIVLWANSGCRGPALRAPVSAQRDGEAEDSYSYASYAPAKVDIMPLTELVTASGRESRIHLYVSLLDVFGSQIKSPAVFRFELYEHIVRSAEPKGRRAVIWADFDLTSPAVNNEYWRDFLRAYEFDLPFEHGSGQTYILQVSCLCPNGSRLTSEFTLKQAK
jgi:hypothetical protein